MDPDVVAIATGQVRGTTLANGVRAFLGVPYAVPPLGDLRWKPPVAAQGWSGVRDAVSFAPDAIQGNGIRVSRAAEMSEDCLYLNVWAPTEARPGGWPVIVWSGGGAFNTGSGAFVEEDLARMAARGAVVVSFNYRLGVFGFLAHAALTAESPHGSSGNYGLLDHLAALKWVRRNAAAFGGAADNITYMAESSGAAAGLLMLATPIQSNVFDKAILLSPGSTSPLLPLAEAERSAASLEGTAADLRAIPAEELQALSSKLKAPPSNLSVARPLRPIIDGWVIATDRSYETGAFAAVPAIMGTNEDEGRFFTRRMTIDTLAGYGAYLADTFGAFAAEAGQVYPAASDGDVAAAVADAYGDVSINRPVDRLIDAFAMRQPETYRFVYTYRHGETAVPPTHSEEAGTFLDTREPVTGRDTEMAETIAGYLLSFAETGKPQGRAAWPRYDTGARKYLNIDLPLSVGENWRHDKMAFVAKATETQEVNN